MTSIRSIGIALICFFCVFFSVYISEIYSHAEPIDGFIDRSRTGDAEIRASSDALSRYIMGAIYDNFGKTKAAVAEYEKALTYRDDIAEIYLKIGADLLLLGRLDESAEMLDRVVKTDPQNVKSYLLLAIIHIAKGEFEKAQVQYEEALKYDPENLKVLTFLSDLYVVQQKLDKAAEVYEKILQIREDDAFVYLNLGIIYSKLNLLDKAEEALEKAIEVDKDYLEAQMVLGFIYEIDGKYAEAIEQYKKVTNMDSLNKEAHVRLGQLYHRLGETDQAIEQNRILMQLDVNSPEPYLRNFSIYVSEKRFDEAREVLREALRSGMADAVIYGSLGYLAGLEKHYKEAIDYYTVAIQKDPANDIYRFYLAATVDRTGRRGEAIKILEEVVSRGTQVHEIYNYLGYMYVEENRDLDKAVTLIEKALASDPENGAYIDSLGWAYYKKGMLDEALEEISKAARYMPDDAVIREHLGDVYFAKGDLEKAAQQWQLSLESDPENRKVGEKLKRVKAKLKKQR
jgi:tetratricopeptide (TPR) repeat protein